MFSESLLIGLVTLLLCGAALFYMYIRMTFLEKKFLVMESILVDVRVAMDSLMMDHMHHPAAPIAMTPGVNLPPAHSNESDSDAIPEEKFYSSILEQAHDNDVEQESPSVESVLESFDSTSAPPVSDRSIESVPATANAVAAATTKQNLDSMTRSELVSLAETRGIRVKRSMNRGEVLSLLRSMDSTQNGPLSTAIGAENVSGSMGGAQQNGASVDGTMSMDMEQGEALD